MAGRTDQIRISRRGGHLLLAAALAGFAVGCGSSGGGGGGSSSVSQSPTAQNAEVGTVSAVKDMGVGDIYVVPMVESRGSISFDGASSSAQYTLIVQAANPGGSSSALALGDEVAPESLTKSLGIATNEMDLSVGEAFDLSLRVLEEDLAASQMTPLDSIDGSSKSVRKAITPRTAVGDQQGFRVLSSLGSSSSYNTVTATVMCITSHLVVALDNEDSTALTATELGDLCNRSNEAAKIDIATLGAPSDVNGDGKVTFLLTHRVNQLGAQGGGIVTGFFYAADLYPRTDSNAVSNEQEIVFALVPDPSGSYGSAISKSFAVNNLLTSVLPHEIQHAISYNQHVLLRGGATEKTWLNEALSHNMECVSGYCQENPSRVDLFLDATSGTSLVAGSSANLKQRGAAFLFIRYLYEQASNGAAFLQRLVATDQTDVANIEKAYAGSDASFDQFEEFFFRWAIAVAATNGGIISDSKYVFKDRSFNSTTGQWDGICLQCSAEDGRSTELTGPLLTTFASSANATLAPTGTAFYSVSHQSDPLTISGGASAKLQAVLIRTK